MRWLSDLAGSLRTSFGIGRATISAASLTAAHTVTLPDRSIAIGDVWEYVPLGMKFPIDTHTTGVPVPPTDNPNYRYIKLTASDSYNTGVLTSESVSGSAPLVQATAVINDAGSPLNGQTVQLINTERRVIRAGSSGTVQDDTFQGHDRDIGIYSASISTVSDTSLTPGTSAGNGVIIGQSSGSYSRYQQRTGGLLTRGANGTPRTDNETRPKNIGADYFMRIR